MRKVVVLGSTGSIGTQALEVIASRLDQFQVVGLAAGSNVELLAKQVIEFQPATVALARGSQANGLQQALYREADRRGWSRGDWQLPSLLIGNDAATALARTDCDLVLNAITGAAGLMPTLAALEQGTTLALANKESLVIGGALVTRVARVGQIVPVDSEHSALAQSLLAGERDEVRRLVLTASGGPFRGYTRAELANVTPQQALAHPTWNMGRVVTINSATLVNKGLEVIEASLLFDIPFDRIAVTVHPQSIVHSMVEFNDGSTMAQASPPDMKLPIGLALTWPRRLRDVAQPCDWTTAATWTFEPVDAKTFPAIELARRAGSAGGTAPAVFNAANEVLVDAFCDGAVGFLDIVDVTSRIVDAHLATGHIADDDLTVRAVLDADRTARDAARRAVRA